MTADRGSRLNAYAADTPHFLFNPDELRRQVRPFAEALPDAQLYYALKANSEPAVLKTIAELGLGFEAASWGEIELLRSLDLSPGSIIYGTSVKPRDHVASAVAYGIDRFAADSVEELNMLAEIAPGCRVMLRARVDDSASVFRMSLKFGAPVDSVADLLRCAQQLGLVPWGVSFNVGSQCTRAAAWADAIRLVGPTLNELHAEGLCVEVLNLGGGFPVSYRNHVDVPTLTAIADHVRSALGGLPYQPRVILEPGRGLVATCMQLVTSVVSRVERDDGSWLFLDAGVYNALFEAMAYQGDTRYPVSATWSRLEDEPLRRFVLAGPTGDGIDILDRDVALPDRIGVGDRLIFENAGAYTIALASTFNGFAKAPVVSRTRSDEARTITDTRASREAIGFPETPTQWCRAPAEFDGGLLRILGHPVMQDWEAAYMRQLAAVATAAGGTVLEIGYGLGLGSAAIQEVPGVERHLVVECHPDVAARCCSEQREAIARQRLQLFVGLWQDVTPLLTAASFDGILFDSYPLTLDEVHRNHFSFFAEAHRLLKPGGVLTYYSDEARTYSEEHIGCLLAAGFQLDHVDSEVCAVDPPAGCQYWQADSLLVPIIRKTLEP